MEAADWPESWLATTLGTICPNCGEQAGRPILRGFPTYEVFEAMDAGTIDIVLGGCLVSNDDLTLECSNCKTEFTPPASA